MRIFLTFRFILPHFKAQGYATIIFLRSFFGQMASHRALRYSFLKFLEF